jgi:hypothetical protein
LSLHFTKALKNIKINIGSECDSELNELAIEFTDATQQPQGLPPHRVIFYHKIRLTANPKRQRRNRISVPEFEELKR